MISIGISPVFTRQKLKDLIDYIARVEDDGSIIINTSDVLSILSYFKSNDLLDSIELLYLSTGGLSIRDAAGNLQYIEKTYSLDQNSTPNDGTQTVELSQPRLVGGIAPNSKVTFSNQSGETRTFNHPVINVSGTYTVATYKDDFGKFVMGYTNPTTGTLSSLVWYGNLKFYAVFSVELTVPQETALTNLIETIYKPIESTVIGVEEWSTRNFESITTPEGNTIAITPTTGSWITATSLYDTAYAEYEGTATEKNYAGLKAAAMCCYYAGSLNNGAVYGKLYNGYAAKLLSLDFLSSSFGWRVTEEADWAFLVPDDSDDSLKMTETLYWETGSEGTNADGLTVLGAGIRATNGEFGGLRSITQFWNSDDTTSNLLYGCSIRLIKE